MNGYLLNIWGKNTEEIKFSKAVEMFKTENKMF